MKHLSSYKDHTELDLGAKELRIANQPETFTVMVLDRDKKLE